MAKSVDNVVEGLLQTHEGAQRRVVNGTSSVEGQSGSVHDDSTENGTERSKKYLLN